MNNDLCASEVVEKLRSVKEDNVQRDLIGEAIEVIDRLICLTQRNTTNDGIAELGLPTPKSTTRKPLRECKFYAINGLLYMNDGTSDQNLIASFRRTTINNESFEKEVTEFAAHCMNGGFLLREY